MTASPLAPTRILVALALLAAPGCAHESPAARTPAPAATTAAEPVLDQGRRLTRAFYEGNTQEMWERFDADLRTLFVDRAGLDHFREEARAQLGAESSVVDERTGRGEGVTLYVRVARFQRVSVPIRVVLGFAADGRVAGFAIRPDQAATSEAPTDKLGYATRTALHLPFAGAWSVAWGGRTVAENHHASTRDQRFAYDFVVKKGGSTHAGDGSRNSDYYAYGQPVLAPAAGRVVVAVDGVPENEPGHMDGDRPFGNNVVIDHGDGEFSFLAHLVPGSLTVHEGDRVEAGRVLGRCGNSGHSSEPHLHYHLQDTAKHFAGDGLPAPWVDYRADGQPVARGEATRGQVVVTAVPAGSRGGS